MKQVLALLAMGASASLAQPAAAAPSAGSLTWTAVQSRGFPKPPKQKSGFDKTRRKIADKTVGKGRPKDKLDDLRRRGVTGQEKERERGGDDQQRPDRGAERPLPEKGPDVETGTDLSPENHVRALRLEVHAMRDELTLKAKKDGVKLRSSLADEPESDLARFTAFKVAFYQDLCAWLTTCDDSLRLGRGVATGLRTPRITAPRKDGPAEDEAEDKDGEEDGRSFDVMRRRFLEYLVKTHAKEARKEDRPLLRTFHERLAGHAAALIQHPTPTPAKDVSSGRKDVTGGR